MADVLGTDVETVVDGRIAGNAMRAVSIDAPAASERNPQTLADTHGVDDDGYARAEDRATVAALANVLRPRERQILSLRYGEEELTQREIGRRIGVSQMQVSRLLKRIETELVAAASRQSAARTGSCPRPTAARTSASPRTPAAR